MSSKYVRGVKRNQIIQRWLQGIEDPEYEVFPTKKEGKYIVRLRETKLVDQTNNDVDKQSVDVDVDKQSVDVTNDVESETESTPPPVIKQRRPRTSSSTIPSTRPDSTINLEILEQLRNLGEEIRNDRFKKEQKQYIKHVVNKELSKSRIRSRYVPEMFATQNPQSGFPESVESEPVESKPVAPQPVEPQSVEPEPEPIIEQPIFRSRIRR